VNGIGEIISPKSKRMHIFLSIVLLLLASSTLWAADEAKRVLALVDYIGGDYRNAVQGGKVINTDEYQEMTEFSARSLELFHQLLNNG
jgi:high-affinity iron transporter